MSVDTPADAGAIDALLLHFARTVFLDKPPRRIGVAVSGGGDSMALLHLYARLARDDGLEVAAVTVDHGLRSDAAAEAAHVARFCKAAGISHDTLRWEGWDGKGNLMAAARDARYRLIADWAHARGIGAVVLGHTADDQAENFLIRLARKSGPDGLAGMDVRFERHGITWARPLWQQSRDDLRDYLRRHGVAWIDDPTNEDDTYERSRVRKALVKLEALGITADVLKSVGVTMRATKDALDYYARIEAAKYIRQEHGDLVLHLAQTDALPMEMRRRLWRAMLPWVSGASYPPRSRALFETIHGLSAEGNTTVGGCLITRKGEMWRVTREYNAVADLIGPTTAIWDNRWQLSGPHADDLEVRALGDGIADCPGWRDTGLPRASLLATPAVWRGDTLIAAPIAGLSNGWTAQIVADFHEEAFAH